MKELKIKSHKGIYSARFIDDPFQILSSFNEQKPHFIVDANVYELYKNQLEPILKDNSTLIIEATEENKSLEKIPYYIEELVNNNIKRNHILVAIGGGIIQDITCFMATNLFRGMQWAFFPTTLLAQADSCIGSKSSINTCQIKNLLGSFYPPKEIFIATSFLETLKETDILSGIGEMIKVHIIAGQSNFSDIASNYSALFSDKAILEHFILESLKIKQSLIEEDEFDQGPRNIMNYGHSFGHAIESASNYKIPHGIAVAMGMNMANSFSASNNNISTEQSSNMKELLSQVYSKHTAAEVNRESFFSSLCMDKKNVGNKITLIVPMGENAKITKIQIDKSDEFITFCNSQLDNFQHND